MSAFELLNVVDMHNNAKRNIYIDLFI